MNNLQQLPDTARVWVFPFRETLTASQMQTFSQAMNTFLSQWMSHGARVRGGFEVCEERFLVVAADTSLDDVSGCSIDGLFRSVAEMVSQVGSSLSDNTQIFFREGNTVREMDRPTFRKYVQAGNVTAETIVYDNSVVSLAEVRKGKWQIPFASSWHATHFAPRAKAQS
ncbi:MAG: hypothetical protein K1Y36_03435 [Blastocatellia bacterium]|nr:hypothetical protein [Blastocatellia bacterium]